MHRLTDNAEKLAVTRRINSRRLSNVKLDLSQQGRAGHGMAWHVVALNKTRQRRYYRGGVQICIYTGRPWTGRHGARSVTWGRYAQDSEILLPREVYKGKGAEEGSSYLSYI